MSAFLRPVAEIDREIERVTREFAWKEHNHRIERAEITKITRLSIALLLCSLAYLWLIA